MIDPLTLREIAPRICVVGVDGYIGSRLFSLLAPYGATGTTRRPNAAWSPRMHFLDLGNPDSIRRFAIVPPTEVAVIVGAVASPEACYRDPKGSYQVNVAGLAQLVELLEGRGIAPLFASTEAVFSGEGGPFSEDDPAHPIMEYGRQKLEGERFVLSVKNGLVLRIGRAYGNCRGDGTLFSSALEAVEAGSMLNVAVDQFFSVIHLDEVCEAVMRLIQVQAKGVVHVASPFAGSRFELVSALIKEKLGEQRCSQLLRAVSIGEFRVSELRPRDTRLRVDRLCGLTGMNFKSPSAWFAGWEVNVHA